MATAAKKTEADAPEATDEPQAATPEPFLIVAPDDVEFKAASGQPAINLALWNVINEMPDLQESGSYNITKDTKIHYIPTRDIVKTAKPLMLKYGIIVTPKVLNSRTQFDHGRTFTMEGREIGDGRPATMRVHRLVEVEFTFASVADGSSFTATAEGEGIDTAGDKATRKAHTSAYRNALFVVYQLTTHEDEQTSPLDDAPATDRAAQQREQARGAAQGGTTKAVAAATPKPAAQTPPAAAKPAGQATQEAAAKVAESDKPAAEPEAPAEPVADEQLAKAPAPDLDSLDGLKREIQSLNLQLGSALGMGEGVVGVDRVSADALMEELIKKGIKRADWINKPTHLRKLRDHLASALTEAKAGPAEIAGTE